MTSRSSPLAWVMKIRSPQTTGVEFPPSGKATFHFTCSVALQRSGRSVSEEIPEPSAPRHPGHGAAGTARMRTAQSNVIRKSAGFTGEEVWCY